MIASPKLALVAGAGVACVADLRPWAEKFQEPRGV